MWRLFLYETNYLKIIEMFQTPVRFWKSLTPSMCHNCYYTFWIWVTKIGRKIFEKGSKRFEINLKTIRKSCKLKEIPKKIEKIRLWLKRSEKCIKNNSRKIRQRFESDSKRIRRRYDPKYDINSQKMKERERERERMKRKEEMWQGRDGRRGG